MANAADIVGQFIKTIPLSSVANLAAVAAGPQTKRRAAVVAHDAYAAIDGYMAAKPSLFYGGLMLTAAGGAMAVKRWRQGPEAVAAWLVMASLGAVMSYTTRPGANGAAGTTNGAPALETVNRWLDNRAVTLDRTDPGWQERALARLLG